ncbi:MAG: hypothetical protein QOF83_1878, partial [Solirubrobacteraceae bacterium]|nr:hypothetical protein [Solirubrobacteraceae bacterium]
KQARESPLLASGGKLDSLESGSISADTLFAPIAVAIQR